MQFCGSDSMTARPQDNIIQASGNRRQATGDSQCQGRCGVFGLPCRLAPSLKSRTAGFFNARPGPGKNILLQVLL